MVIFTQEQGENDDVNIKIGILEIRRGVSGDFGARGARSNASRVSDPGEIRLVSRPIVVGVALLFREALG